MGIRPRLNRENLKPTSPDRILTTTEARRRHDEMRSTLEDIGQDLLRLEEQRGFIPLGYSSMDSLIANQFPGEVEMMHGLLDTARRNGGGTTA